MVSKILKKHIEEYYEDLARLGIPRSLADHYVDILVEIAESSYTRFLITSFNIVNQLALKAFCAKRKFEEACYRDVPTDPEIEYYKLVLFRVLRIAGLAKVIPEVGSNLVYAPSTPRGISDIIGLTGRIVRVFDAVTFYGEPMYGGSRHVAKVLLIASKYNPNLKFCMNVKCSGLLEEHLRNLGYRVLGKGPHLKEEDFWIELEQAVQENPSIICDYGGLGLEPVAYIFTTTPEELESLLVATVEAWR